MNNKEKIVLQKIQDYFLTVAEIDRLYSLLLENGDFEGSITAKYSSTGGSRTNAFSSKVESGALRKLKIEERIKELSTEIHYIDEACKYINKDEKNVIDRIIEQKKLTDIAREFNCTRKRIEKLRNSAVTKITDKILSWNL